MNWVNYHGLPPVAFFASHISNSYVFHPANYKKNL